MSPLDTYHAERHPVAARVLRNTLAQVALRRPDDRSHALGETLAALLAMEEPRRRMAAETSELGIHDDLGAGHPLLGRRMPDLDLTLAGSPCRAFALLHAARPVLLNLREPGAFDLSRWCGRIVAIAASYGGPWTLPVIGPGVRPPRSGPARRLRRLGGKRHAGWAHGGTEPLLRTTRERGGVVWFSREREPPDRALTGGVRRRLSGQRSGSRGARRSAASPPPDAAAAAR
jgi:hypothetical protein